MYEKIVFICLCSFLLFGCRTTIVYDNGSGIASAREEVSELENLERENSERIERMSEELSKGTDRLGEVITELANSTSNYSEFETILDIVRRRKTGLTEKDFEDTE